MKYIAERQYSYLFMYPIFLGFMFYSIYNLALKMKEIEVCEGKYEALYLLLASNFVIFFVVSHE